MIILDRAAPLGTVAAMLLLVAAPIADPATDSVWAGSTPAVPLIDTSNGATDPPPPATAPTLGGDAWDGEPVDLSTGLFVHRETDLYLHDVMALALTRTYRPGDTASRPFGIGASHPYALYLYSALQHQEADLVLPDGSKIHYARTTPGNDIETAAFEHTGSPTAFNKSTIGRGSFWALRLTDGTVYAF